MGGGGRGNVTTPVLVSPPDVCHLSVTPPHPPATRGDGHGTDGTCWGQRHYMDHSGAVHSHGIKGREGKVNFIISKEKLQHGLKITAQNNNLTSQN